MPRDKVNSSTQYAWLLERIAQPEGECLIWPFFRDPTWGRGRLLLDGRLQWAHRVMCALIKGPPPKGKPQALHSCGNGHLGCVHPRHLSWGTNSENAIDRRRHGRREGGQGARTHLSPEVVAEIQAGGSSQLALAKKFNISRSAVQYWQGIGRGPRPWSNNKYVVRKREKRRAAREQRAAGARMCQ